MKLSNEATRQLEIFFRKFSGDDQLHLPLVHFFSGRAVGLAMRTLRIGGLTIGSYVFVAPEMVRVHAGGSTAVVGWLAAHEVCHVLQYQRRGLLGFLSGYLGGYALALARERRLGRNARHAAYISLPEESEAMRAEAAYLVWLPSSGFGT